MSAGSAPCRVSASTAPAISRSTIRSLKRDATMPIRKPRAFGSPLNTRTRSSTALLPRVVRIHVLDDLEPEARQRVHVLRRGQHPHPADAERAQDLRTGAERPEIHRRVAPARELLARLAERADGVDQVARGLVEPQQH